MKTFFRSLLILAASIVAFIHVPAFGTTPYSLPVQVASAKESPLLSSIRKRGEIAIGVKADFPYFGSRDSSGNVVGFEVDLAQAIADRLGVRLKKVVVNNEDRFQKLEQGLIDVSIATAFDTSERRRIATAIEPNYYGAGTTVMMRPEHPANDWVDVRGQTLCALQGAYFNRLIAQRYLVKLDLYRNARDATLALSEGRCIGYLHSEVSISQYLRQPEWQNYRATFPPAIITPWAISIPRSEQGTEFDRWMGDLVADWHRSGFLIGLEKHWGIPPSKFLKDAYFLWNKKSNNGEYLCQRNVLGEWPIECRNSEFLVAKDADGLQGFGLWLRESLGIDLSITYDGYDASRFITGLCYSLLLIVGAVIIAISLGVVGFRVLLTKPRLLVSIATMIGSYGRLTPPLLQMYLLFFGIGGIISAVFAFKISAFVVAVWCTGAYAGCQIMFILRDASYFLQPEDPLLATRADHLASLISYCITPIKGILINLTKQTTMASSLAVPELLYATIAIVGDRGNIWVMMGTLLLVFLTINSIWSALLNQAENMIRQRLSKMSYA